MKRKVKNLIGYMLLLSFSFTGCEKKQANDVQAVSVENVRVVSDSKSDTLTEKINMDNTDVVETIGIISFASDPVANKKYLLAEDGGVIASFGYETFPYDKRDIKVFEKTIFDNGAMLGLEIKEIREQGDITEESSYKPSLYTLYYLNPYSGVYKELAEGIKIEFNFLPKNKMHESDKKLQFVLYAKINGEHIFSKRTYADYNKIEFTQTKGQNYFWAINEDGEIVHDIYFESDYWGDIFPIELNDDGTYDLNVSVIEQDTHYTIDLTNDTATFVGTKKRPIGKM